MTLKHPIIIHKQHPSTRIPRIHALDRAAQLGIRGRNKRVHPRADIPRQLRRRLAVPHAEGHVVALGALGIEEARVARDGNGEAGPLLPADGVEELLQDDGEAQLEVRACDGGIAGGEGGLARARVEGVEAEDAGVHDVEEAQVVTADGEGGEVEGEGGVELVDLGEGGGGEEVDGS